MPTIQEAIENFTTHLDAMANRLISISTHLEELATLTDKTKAFEQASTLRKQLLILLPNAILSETVTYTLLALCEKYPENSSTIGSYMADDKSKDNLLCLTEGYAFGKKWLAQYISSSGYINPVNRKSFSDLDKSIISVATGIPFHYKPPHPPNDRPELTINASASTYNRERVVPTSNQALIFLVNNQTSASRASPQVPVIPIPYQGSAYRRASNQKPLNPTSHREPAYRSRTQVPAYKSRAQIPANRAKNQVPVSPASNAISSYRRPSNQRPMTLQSSIGFFPRSEMSLEEREKILRDVYP
ncbi:MAG: hypothetical protein NTW08_09460 [Gammaproteobacteria bacterium]|nr:hypothetical protein [Gammaproteobacteria bacterium]